MSAALFLKSSTKRLPLDVFGRAAGCRYHTERGVYGFRPKRSPGGDELLSERITALNQGQRPTRTI